MLIPTTSCNCCLDLDVYPGVRGGTFFFFKNLGLGIFFATINRRYVFSCLLFLFLAAIVDQWQDPLIHYVLQKGYVRNLSFAICLFTITVYRKKPRCMPASFLFSSQSWFSRIFLSVSLGGHGFIDFVFVLGHISY